ncbi:hypothetical protein TRFO_31041 [Tritrichomonas foetus]|uniref:Doublecortin domain-containing protein n=1 Tax=Tritrichomonas foetus TaxID=1144522 RepID=A0A1J4JS85_9EUKA|nr:hypothetical protein TRFO_31041 [Tritrichomonas foetus]|eukprot:OHT01969.1 hypothetical protein TRFO_31041 [Tritrichomonas foetus]
MEGENLTTQASYVYVYMKGQKKKFIKKALVYKSLALFKKSVYKLFTPPDPILTILTEDGKVITKTEELENGRTYIASTVDTDFEKKINLPPPPPGSPEAKKRKPFLFTNPLTQVNFSELMDQLPEDEGKDTKSPTKKLDQKLKFKDDENEDGNMDDEIPRGKKLIPKQAIAIASFRKKNSLKTSQPFKFGVKYPTNQSTRIDMRKISRAPTPSSTSSEDDSARNQSDIEEDNDKSSNLSPTNKSITSRFSNYSKDRKDFGRRKSSLSKSAKYLTKIVDSSDSDEESPEAIKRREARATAKRQQEIFESQTPFEQMIGELIQPENVPKCYSQALSALTDDRQQFISNISDMEGEQMYLWIRMASQQPFLQRAPLQPYHDPTTMQAAEFFANHRGVISNGFAMYRFRSAIVGPRKSGKTTVLANFVDQFLSELATAGAYRNTFVLVLDMKVLAPMLENVRELYRFMIKLILNALVNQRPTIQSEISKIKRQFYSVTEGSRVLIPKHGFQDLDSLAVNLNRIYKDPDAFEVWLTNVFMLPVLIPRAVGFKGIALFFDNFEYGDCLVQAKEPFRLSYSVFAIEHIKFGMSHANYMVTCESNTRLYEVLSPVDEDGIDCYSGIDYISTMDVTQDIGSRAHVKYLLEVQEEPEPIEIVAEMCGGIVAYLILWDELNLTMFRLDRCDPKSDTYLEAYYDAIAQAQRLVDLLFVCEGSKKITVCGVKRISKLKQFVLSEEDDY